MHPLLSGGYTRSELAGPYVRVSETLERSAQLAERHAQTSRARAGWPRLPSNWSAPGEGARRGRALAARRQ
jgi:hypothetical protein